MHCGQHISDSYEYHSPQKFREKGTLQASKDHTLKNLPLKRLRQVNFTNFLQAWPGSLSKQQIRRKTE
ncbi:hypothetical protein PMIT1327_00328 [Prochlorococcus marinus str. MIT 1327]|nr:hypothetical protein PMIT1312_00227 [Prochlorococcus marinus str. MIT 1312]KZR83784.1 hypothetical protein PMIT1327_00328 [Prochlorococcus marinus str. MIT 1327]